MKHKIYIFIFLTLSVNLFAQTYVSSTRQNISVPIYNNADLQIGKDSFNRITDLYDDGSTFVRDSLISRTKFQFLKDVADNTSIDFTNTNGILSATIQSGAITDAMLSSPKQDPLISGTTIKTVNGNSLLGSGNLSISAGAGGSNNQVQYNNSGALAGASNVSIQNNNLKIGSKEFVEDNYLLKYANNYLSGGLRNYINKKISLISPTNGSTLTGLAVQSLTITGANVSQTFATTNLYTRARKLITRQSTAGINAIAGYREALASWILDEGIYYGCTFGFNEGLQPTSRCFIGLANSVAAPTDINPSTNNNIIGIGFDDTDQNLNIFVNDASGAATKIDTGIPVPTTTQDKVYEFEFWGNNLGVTFRLKELISNTVFTSSIQTSDLPTTYLSNRWWLSCGGTSCNPAISILALYLENNN